MLPDGVKFCDKCGIKVLSDAAEIAQGVKIKTVSGFRIIIGIIAALLAFGVLSAALRLILKIGAVFLFGAESIEGYNNAEAIGNILGFIGGAYLSYLVYIAITEKDRIKEKKKWYQSIRLVVIVAITTSIIISSIVVYLSIMFPSP